jgi:hypothetical protein
MNCAETLSALSTASLRDMAPDSPIMQHCAECAECSRVTSMVRQQEYEAASVLNGLPPMSDPIALAEQSVVSSARRRTGRIAVMFTGAALVATICIASWLTIIPALNNADARNELTLRTETIQLSCMSPQQAGDIISPYVRSHGSTFYVPTSGLRAITVRGTVSEISHSREVIADFESDPAAACRLPPGTPGASDDGDAMSQAVRDGVAGALAGQAAAVAGRAAAIADQAAAKASRAPSTVPPALKTR